MSTDFEDRLRTELDAEPVEVPLDADQVMVRGRRAVGARRVGAAVAGAAVLAVVASVVIPLAIGRTVPATPPPGPVSTPSATPAAPTLLGTAWTGVSVLGTPVGSRLVTLQFTDSGVHASDGCNSFSQVSSDRYRQSGEKLTIGDGAVSLVACPASRTTLLLDALNQTTRFRIDAGRLVLLDDAGTDLAEFDPFEVDDRTWHLGSSTGSWVGKDSAITLRVEGNRITGNSGCGDYTGGISREGADWRVSDVTITAPIPCPATAGERASRFLRLLEQTTSAQPYAPETLRLHSPDDDLVFTLRG